MTVTLRPFVEDDAGWLDDWFPAVASSVGYDALAPGSPGASLLARAAADATTLARVIERDAERQGVLVCRVGVPRPDAATIEIVATPPLLARRGSGMAAATVIENELRDRGAVAVYAPAPAIHGIDVYFWIRLGYRPLLRAEWPCERPGTAWLLRDI